jgi:Domain of unknown function (DUF4180)
MNARLIERDGHRMLVADAAGAIMGGVQDALDLVGEAWAQRASVIVVPIVRLDPAFFRLRSGLAGEFIQKIVNYRLKLALIGDISAGIAESDALRDFVRESNRGNAVFFLADLDALVDKLSAIRQRRQSD